MQLTVLICALLAADPGEGYDAAIYKDAETWRAYMLRQIDEPPKAHEEPPDPDPWAFSSFRGVRPEPMGEQTYINGAVMRIATLTVDMPPHVVEEEYLKAFSFAGIVPLRSELPDTRGVRYLSYRPDGSKNLKTLTLVPNGPGTVVLASIGDPSPMVEPPPEVPAGFPVPPGSERGVTIQQREPGASTRSSTFFVRGVNTTRCRASTGRNWRSAATAGRARTSRPTPSPTTRASSPSR